jgi:hypothetical protein
MIDRQEARSDVARIDPAADRWLHTANRARATTDPRDGANRRKSKVASYPYDFQEHKNKFNIDSGPVAPYQILNW